MVLTEIRSIPQNRVRVLPPEVADKIAAGEVVERPASVVKELVENALDAAARTVRVELEDAGIGLIAVIDDGLGMSDEDAVCAFQRHATSKVRDVDDLFRITTLGFRGEALASIAAVSTTTLVTRMHGDLDGTHVLVRAGVMSEVRAIGCPPGTRVEVVDLFGNTPARRKFLKAPGTEVGHVSELVTRTALSFPHVSFSLRHGKRTLLDYPAVRDPAERLAQVFGPERAAAMLPFHGRSNAGEIRGWLTGSHISLPSPRQIFTYVNGRYVRDKLVSHALVAGYSTLLMHGRYPAAVVFIDVPSGDVDVNVHPAKSEVRFRRGGAVHDLITRSVMERLRVQPSPLSPEPSDRQALADVQPQSNSTPNSYALPFALRPIYSAPLTAAATFSAMIAPTPSGNYAPYTGSTSSQIPEQGAGGLGFGRLRVIGQAFEGYLVCEGGDSLVIIDQHAAHERVMFERLRLAYTAGGVQRQGLLVPVIVDVGPQAAALISEQSDDLRNLGFEIEGFGGGSLAVRSVPAVLGDSDPATLVRDLADELTEVGRSRRLVQPAESVLARLACHSAVRVGQTLGPDQIQALLQAMDSVDFATNCPHGRPAFIKLARGDLERLVRRV